MKKQKIQMLVLLAILVVLAAGFLGIRQYNQMQSEEPQEETGITVVDIAVEDIVRFSYDYEDVTYTFEKEEDTWYAAEDHSLNLVQTSVNSMITDVGPLVAEQVIENVTDMSQYGLAQPSRTISFETASESYIFYVGDFNDVSSVYYLCRPSETTVYVVPALTVNRFNRTLEELVEEEESTETATKTSETEETVTETETGETVTETETAEEAQETVAETETAAETQETVAEPEE